MAVEKLKRVRILDAGFRRIRIELSGSSGVPVVYEAELPLEIDLSGTDAGKQAGPVPIRQEAVPIVKPAAPGNGIPKPAPVAEEKQSTVFTAPPSKEPPLKRTPPIVPPSPGLKLRFTDQILGEDLMDNLQAIRVLDPHGRETDLGLILRRELSQLFGMRVEVAHIRARTGSTLKNFTDAEVMHYFESLRKLATAA